MQEKQNPATAEIWRYQIRTLYAVSMCQGCQNQRTAVGRSCKLAGGQGRLRIKLDPLERPLFFFSSKSLLDHSRQHCGCKGLRFEREIAELNEGQHLQFSWCYVTFACTLEPLCPQSGMAVARRHAAAPRLALGVAARRRFAMVSALKHVLSGGGGQWVWTSLSSQEETLQKAGCWKVSSLTLELQITQT